MATIEYRPSRPDDYPDIHKILNVGKSAAQIAVRTANFEWQYTGSPNCDGRSPFLVVTVDGRIGGVNGLIPVRIRYRNQPVLAVWSCDTAVLNEHRGKGLGKGLVTQVSAQADVVLGYGISDMSDPIFAKHGWDLNSDMRCFFFAMAEQGTKGLIKNAYSSGVRLLHRRTKVDGLAITVSEGTPFNDEVDHLWASNAEGYPSAVERTSSYLNWRYIRHPRLRYITYQARRHGELVALLIARADATQSVIVDYCGPAAHADIKATLLDAAIEDIRRRGTKRIACQTNDPAFSDALRCSGFRATKDRPRFRVWSNRAGDSNRAADWLVVTGDSATS